MSDNQDYYMKLAQSIVGSSAFVEPPFSLDLCNEESLLKCQIEDSPTIQEHVELKLSSAEAFTAQNCDKIQENVQHKFISEQSNTATLTGNGENVQSTYTFEEDEHPASCAFEQNPLEILIVHHSDSDSTVLATVTNTITNLNENKNEKSSSGNENFTFILATFRNVSYWPKKNTNKNSTPKKIKIKVPSVVTSAQWKKYHEEK